MSEKRTITGERGEVVMGEVPGGWAWHCHTCNARAGMASGKRRPDGVAFATLADPFVDKEINGVQATGEGHCARSATMHADQRCAGEATKTWKPPTYHPEEE